MMDRLLTAGLCGNCHNEDGRIQLRKREFITRSNTQRELNGAFRRQRGGASVGRNGAFRRG